MSCGYNPTAKRASYADEYHAKATWVVGHAGKWYLCDECVKLPEFKNYQIKEKLNDKINYD